MSFIAGVVPPVEYTVTPFPKLQAAKLLLVLKSKFNWVRLGVPSTNVLLLFL